MSIPDHSKILSKVVGGGWPEDLHFFAAVGCFSKAVALWLKPAHPSPRDSSKSRQQTEMWSLDIPHKSKPSVSALSAFPYTALPKSASLLGSLPKGLAAGLRLRSAESCEPFGPRASTGRLPHEHGSLATETDFLSLRAKCRTQLQMPSHSASICCECIIVQFLAECR